jgi:hypothetical protein
MMKPGTDTAVIGENVPDGPTLSTYENATYGLRFSYPDTYVLSERDEPGSALRMHHSITLMDKTAAANIPQGGEGPTTITIDIFGNGIDKQSVDQWIKNTSKSNFKLSPDQTLSTTTIDSLSARSYTWDGLYRGESSVLSKGDNIYMFSVTYMDTLDRIRDDFAALLSTVKFQ